jgi:hypothetical protein
MVGDASSIVHAKDAEELATVSKGERRRNREAEKSEKEKPKIRA